MAGARVAARCGAHRVAENLARAPLTVSLPEDIPLTGHCRRRLKNDPVSSLGF